MVTITIDGKEIQACEGKNVLDAALEAGIYIPHLCHHPDLTPMGSCRMCIVEVDGREIEASCELQVSDGLNILTRTDEIDRLRRLAMELLLCGHPADCTACVKYGSCELQTLIQYLGVTPGRMRSRVKGLPENAENPLFDHDMKRCVLCSRCVRACRDLRGVGVLHYNKKEAETYIGTLHDKLLSDSGCRFCGACAEVCPTGTIRDKERLINSKMNRAEALVPCRTACPAGIDAPRYIRLIKEGKLAEAIAVIREKVPFPSVLGHICNHVCEDKCRRGEVNEPVSIRNLKRFAAAQDELELWRGKAKQLSDTKKHVAVIGSGPAGLTAAYYLRKQGHGVTIFEKLAELGGMLRVGIPAYRLPREELEKEIRVIADSGVIFKTNSAMTDSAALIKDGYDAVVIAIGAHTGAVLPIPGNDLQGVTTCTAFLREASLGMPTGIGKNAVVLGGGNVAFDCARTAVRLGAKVSLVCLEAEDSMLAAKEEISEAAEEGVSIFPARSFEEICGDGHVTGVKLMKVTSFTFDENRRPVLGKEDNSQHIIEADTVIFAVGQYPDLPASLESNPVRGRYINVEETQQTANPGVFAAGDVIYGTDSVIRAIASGRIAAAAADKYLGGDGDISEILAPAESPEPVLGMKEDFAGEPRHLPALQPAGERKGSFGAVDKGFTAGDSICESGRCLSCDLRLTIARPRLWSAYSDMEAKA